MLPDRLLRFTNATDLCCSFWLTRCGNRQAAHGFDLSDIDRRWVSICIETVDLQLHRSSDLPLPGKSGAYALWAKQFAGSNGFGSQENSLTPERKAARRNC